MHPRVDGQGGKHERSGGERHKGLLRHVRLRVDEEVKVKHHQGRGERDRRRAARDGSHPIVGRRREHAAADRADVEDRHAARRQDRAKAAVPGRRKGGPPCRRDGEGLANLGDGATHVRASTLISDPGFENGRGDGNRACGDEAARRDGKAHERCKNEEGQRARRREGTCAHQEREHVLVDCAL